MTLYTEAEAAERWCPMFRIGIATALGERPSYVSNRDGVPGNEPLWACIGSRCMAWQWADDDDFMEQRTRGYCGAFRREGAKQ